MAARLSVRAFAVPNRVSVGFCIGIRSDPIFSKKFTCGLDRRPGIQFARFKREQISAYNLRINLGWSGLVGG